MLLASKDKNRLNNKRDEFMGICKGTSADFGNQNAILQYQQQAFIEERKTMPSPSRTAKEDPQPRTQSSQEHACLKMSKYDSKSDESENVRLLNAQEEEKLMQE